MTRYGKPSRLAASERNPAHRRRIAGLQASDHLDRAYDSKVTRELLESRALSGVISEKGKPAPLQAR